MFKDYHISRKKLYILLITISILIMVLSAEVLMEVKDRGRFVQWFEEIQTRDTLRVSEEEAFDAYVSGNILLYMLNLVIPLGFAVHTFFAYQKGKINSLFIFLWFIMLIGGLAFTFVSWNFDSLFYFVRIAAYLVLIGITLALSTGTEISKKQ